MKLKGKRFATVEEIRTTQEALDLMIKDDYRNCFQEWEKQWDKCIASEGEYFEGD